MGFMDPMAGSSWTPTVPGQCLGVSFGLCLNDELPPNPEKETKVVNCFLIRTFGFHWRFSEAAYY